MWETWVQSPGWEGPLEKEMATYSSTLAWKIPWMEEPGKLQSMGSQRLTGGWATSLLIPYTKINSKWLKDLSIRQDTIRLPEENIGKTFSDVNSTNVFLGQSPKAVEIKVKINKWDLIKLTTFENHNQQKKP